MFGIGLLCLAVFVPPLYGMEAMDCGFDDRLLEVNKTERSGWDSDENKSFDWSANKVNGKITVPYRYVSRYQKGTPGGGLESDNPSWYTVNAIESAFRYIEDHVGCIKFEATTNSDKKSLLMHINSWMRCGTGAAGKVHARLRNDIYLEMKNAPCNGGQYKDLIENIDKPFKTCTTWVQPWYGPMYCRDTKDDYSIWFQVFVHEVFHVFGIAHTMKRTDRDEYINVLYGNIPNDTLTRHQYKMDARIPVPNTPYECNSIMHYQSKIYEGMDGPNFVAHNPSTCKFESKGPTFNDWKALKSKVCDN